MCQLSAVSAGLLQSPPPGIPEWPGSVCGGLGFSSWGGRGVSAFSGAPGLPAPAADGAGTSPRARPQGWGCGDDFQVASRCPSIPLWEPGGFGGRTRVSRPASGSWPRFWTAPSAPPSPDEWQALMFSFLLVFLPSRLRSSQIRRRRNREFSDFPETKGVGVEIPERKVQRGAPCSRAAYRCFPFS